MQTRVDKSTKSAKYSFDSLAELARYLDDTPRAWPYRDSEQIKPSATWCLKTPYDKAWSLARDGWIEGAQKAQDALKHFPPMTPAPAVRTDFYGHMPHVPRFCAGAPDSMLRHVRDANAGYRAVLSLIVPVNALANVPAQCMANFGVAVAQYINQMETNGVRVDVTGAMVSNVSGWRVAHTWKIKRAEQPLDLAVLAFAIGHPAMFRRIGFALRERSVAPATRSYGNTVACEVTDAINAPVGAIVLNGMMLANKIARTPEDALAYITKYIDSALEKQELTA